MAQNNKTNWHKVLIDIVNTEPSKKDVTVDGKQFLFQNIGDLKSRIGYLLIWEQITKEAVQISRVAAAEGRDMIDFEDKVRLEALPNDLKYKKNPF